jgi:hypothetical protein
MNTFVNLAEMLQKYQYLTSTCKYFRRIFVIYYIISIRQLEYYYQIIFF